MKELTKAEANEASKLVNEPMNCCGRQNAKELLRSRVDRLRRLANNMEILASSLPESFTGSAEEALYQLVIDAGLHH